MPKRDFEQLYNDGEYDGLPLQKLTEELKRYKKNQALDALKESKAKAEAALAAINSQYNKEEAEVAEQDRLLNYAICEQASNDFEKKVLPLRTEILACCLNNQVDQEIRWQAMEAFLQLQNPYPVSKEAFEKECAEIASIKTICENYNGNSVYAQIIEKIEAKYNPAIYFNYALFFDKKTQYEINSCYQEMAEQEAQEQDLNSSSIKVIKLKQAIDLANESIKQYLSAQNVIKRENNDIKTALSTAYERLADSQYDLAQEEIGIAEAIELLVAAKNNYRVVNRKDDVAVDLSIINASYELMDKYKEQGQQNLAREENLAIINRLSKINITKNFVIYPELLFFKLACYSEQYLYTDEQEYRKGTIKFLDEFIPKLKRIKNPDVNIQVWNWVKRYTRLLKITEFNDKFTQVDFTMAAADETDFLQKRLQQAIDGLNKLNQVWFKENHGVELYDHQIEAVNSAAKYFTEQKTSLTDESPSAYYSLPTGAGKTLIMDAELLAIKMPTLIVVPNLQLVEQTIEKLRQLDPNINISRFDGTEKTRFVGGICVTTIQSLQKDLKRAELDRRVPLHNFGLVLFDEAHRSLTKERADIVAQAKKQGAITLGYTATPEFNTKRKKDDYSSVEEVFGSCLYEISLQELIIKRKLLAPVKNIVVNAPPIDPRKFKKKKKEGEDYSAQELEELLNTEKLNKIPVDLYKNGVDPDTGEKLCGKSTLIFCAGIAHAEALTEAFNKEFPGRKYPMAACVHGKMSASKRAKIIELHRSGAIPVLIGCDIFIEGYDNPPDEIAFMLRPTLSEVLAQQRGGRLLRISPGKQYSIIFDWSWGIKQILFRQFLGGQFSVGEIPNNLKQEQLEIAKTEGYEVLWDGSVHPYNMSAKWKANASKDWQNVVPAQQPSLWQQQDEFDQLVEKHLSDKLDTASLQNDPMFQKILNELMQPVTASQTIHKDREAQESSDLLNIEELLLGKNSMEVDQDAPEYKKILADITQIGSVSQTDDVKVGQVYPSLRI